MAVKKLIVKPVFAAVLKQAGHIVIRFERNACAQGVLPHGKFELNLPVRPMLQLQRFERRLTERRLMRLRQPLLYLLPLRTFAFQRKMPNTEFPDDIVTDLYEYGARC